MKIDTCQDKIETIQTT